MASPRDIPLPAAFAALLLAAFLLFGGVARAATSPVSVYGSLVTLRPEIAAPAGATTSATLNAARNETTAFQLLISGGSSGQTGVKVALAETLTGPEGATIPVDDVTIYREDTYNVTTPSSLEGGTGKWPDALIPARDPLFNEERNAFPVNVAANENLAVWVDVLVPVGQAPGAYTGSLAVTAGGNTWKVPVSLTVMNFQLSSTSTFKSAFHADPWQICTAFTGQPSCGNDQLWWELESEFAEIGLDNRMTISNPYPTNGYAPPQSSTEKANFAKYILPVLNGTDPRVRLPGAELTSFDTYENCVTESTTCLGEWKTLATQDGFAERFFLYDCDEPSSTSNWNYCAENAHAAEKSWPGLPHLITANAQEIQEHGAASYTNIPTPTVNDLISNNVDHRSSYNSLLSPASEDELWTYTSCMSYGCDDENTTYGNGWPGYAIDQPAVRSAATGWLGFAYQVRGELYYNVTRAIATATTNQYYSGGNGDGNLFYAGTPTGGHGSIAVGGVHPIPIESLRMKRIREGYQAYEYLRILEERGERAQAMTIFEGLFGPLSHAMDNVTFSAAAMETAKEKLGDLIAASGDSPSVPTPPAETGSLSPAEPESPTVETGSPSPAETGPPTVESPPAKAKTPLVTGKPKTVEAPKTTTAEKPASSPTAIGSAQSASSSHDSKLKVKVIKVKVPSSTKALANEGTRALVTCTTKCKVSVGSQVRKTAARKLKLDGTEVGRGSAVLQPGQKVWVTARATALGRLLPRAVDSTAGLGIRAGVTATEVA